MKLLVVTGMPGTGKEEFLSVARDMDISFIRMGDIVREYYPTRSEEDLELNLGEFATKERNKYGYDIWAKRALKKMSGTMFLIDGCRSLDEVNAYKGLTDDVIIVGIHTPPSLRYERLVKRGRDDAPKSIDDFNQRDSREIGWGLAETLAMSDIMIPNDKSLNEFKQHSKEILLELLK